MRNLLLGIALIVLVGFAGFFYRNAAEHPNQPIACPVDAKLCPDGTAVGRTGIACTFAECPPPNVSLSAAHISFALPEGLTAFTTPDAAVIAAYELKNASSTIGNVVIRSYATEASSTALATIKATAISGTSGLPVPATSFSSTVLGSHRFTVVNIERFEGVIDTAYYLARSNDVLRFDAIDREVMRWIDPALDVTTLPANVALRALLTTLQEN